MPDDVLAFKFAVELRSRHNKQGPRGTVPQSSRTLKQKKSGTTLGESRDFKRSKLYGEMTSINEKIRDNRKI